MTRSLATTSRALRLNVKALPKPLSAQAFATAAAAAAKKMDNATNAVYVSGAALAMDSGSTWHMYPHRDQLCNVRPYDNSIKGIGARGVSQRCREMGDL